MATVAEKLNRTLRSGRKLTENLIAARAKGRLGGSIKGSTVASKERIPVSTSEYSGKLAVRVRALREAKGYTVEKLADKARISVKAMYAYENGTRGIPVDLFPRLARALGVTAGDFFPPLK